MMMQEAIASCKLEGIRVDKKTEERLIEQAILEGSKPNGSKNKKRGKSNDKRT